MSRLLNHLVDSAILLIQDSLLNNDHGSSSSHVHRSVLVGTASNDLLNGSDADDLIVGGLGNDFIVGSLGEDILFGGGGNDFFLRLPNDEDDIVVGGTGNDLVGGGGGNDVLLGGAGNDGLFGAADDDLLYGGAGNDVLFGAEGRDRFVIKAGEGVDSIVDFNPTDDFIGLAGGLTYDQIKIEAVGPSSLITVAATGEVVALVIFVAADQITPANFVQVSEAELYPQYTSILEEDIPSIGVINPQTVGTDASDFLNGGFENDTIRGGLSADVINGGLGSDRLFGEEGGDFINGDYGNDYIDGGIDGDFLNGGLGNDTIIGDAGDDLLNGGFGHDQLFGGANDDIMNGEAGNDILDGGLGFNLLHGGTGSDIFVLGRGARLDQIFDFEKGVDHFKLPEQVSFGQLSFIQTGGNVLIAIAGSNEAPFAIVDRIQASSLTAADFIA
ncbi:MAG TPA: hypothetical protein IGS40_17835 [Trichormus sp. M33_DOE_039]|nr:hypothetical protein [Trichormus sp. M33_DOE_039]